MLKSEYKIEFADLRDKKIENGAQQTSNDCFSLRPDDECSSKDANRFQLL